MLEKIALPLAVQLSNQRTRISQSVDTGQWRTSGLYAGGCHFIVSRYKPGTNIISVCLPNIYCLVLGILQSVTECMHDYAPRHLHCCVFPAIYQTWHSTLLSSLVLLR